MDPGAIPLCAFLPGRLLLISPAPRKDQFVASFKSTWG